jgi:cell wall-associated NlpC family hydrolase
VYASPTFARWLLDRSFLREARQEEARKGDLVFYFNDNGRVSHAGVIVGNNRVESKWGVGHLYQHALFEVPESYGTKVRLFRKLDLEESLEYFRRFAKEKGMFV